MSQPDLTPEQADEIRQRRPAFRGLSVVVGFILVFSALTFWIARLLLHRFAVPPLASGFLAIGIVYCVLALTKPATYWDGESAVRARLRNSAHTVTLVSLFFGGAMILLGLVGIFM